MEKRSFMGNVKMEPEKRSIFGYGAVFNSPSQILYHRDIGEFIESIEPEAFNHLLNDPNIMVLANHDHNMVLGRTGAGTAEIGVDERGLWYRATPPNSRADVLESVERGDMIGSSFGFDIDPEGEEWEQSEGQWQRKIFRFKKVYDLGPVTYPAYLDTTTAARSLRSFREKKEIDQRDELDLYYRKVRFYESPFFESKNI